MQVLTTDQATALVQDGDTIVIGAPDEDFDAIVRIAQKTEEAGLDESETAHAMMEALHG